MADVMLEVKEREKIIRCPDVMGEDGIRGVYGDPTAAVMRAKLVKVWLPYPLFGEWFGQPQVNSLLMHPLIHDSLIDALREVMEMVGADKLREQGWDKLGDAYSYRKKKGGGGLSTHSWGIAIDLNPLLAPWQKKSNQPKVIVDAFEKRGWTWGGRWRNLDGMHFQAAKGY